MLLLERKVERSVRKANPQSASNISNALLRIQLLTEDSTYKKGDNATKN